MASSNRAFHVSGESFSSINKFPRPRPSFKETETLRKVMGLIENYKIVHLYGMSGSGKSQTLSSVCTKMDESPGRIVWHVQCQDTPGALTRELTELILELQKKNLISSEIERGLRKALRGQQGNLNNETQKVLNEFNQKLDLPLLLVIEDVQHDDERKIVKSLIECMTSFFQDVLKIQLLIATRDKNAIYPQQELDALEIYSTYHVRGFTEDEAFKFLTSDGKRISDEAKVRKLGKELAYSPLGLFVVKSYCIKYDLSYEKCYESLGKDEDVKTQRELMKDDQDLRGKDHRHDIITKLLAPKNNDDENERIRSRVILMMSLLSDSHIPTQLIKKFFFVAGKMNPRKQDSSTRHLIERLEREVDAMAWDKDDDEKSLYIHGDIFRALRRQMSAEKKTKLLADVVTALASILDKDNRKRETYLLLHDLRNHAEVVVKLCLEHFDDLLRQPKAEVEDYKILLGLSKISEVVGFAISQHPRAQDGYEEDDYYERATVCIWTTVCSSSSSIWSSLLSRFTKKQGKEEKARFLIDYEIGKDPKETAKKAFKMIEDASLASDNIKQIMQNDSKNSYPLKKGNFKDMKKRLGDEAGVDWAKLEKEIENEGHISDLSQNVLQEKKMLLKWEQLNRYYLAEKLASILHSRGRMDNYKGDIIPDEMHTRCVWYVELGLALCDIAFQKTGVKSMFKFILTANNVLPRLTRNKMNETDDEFMERINKARENARSIMQETTAFYEHGVYKHVSGTPFTLMNAMKYLVKANTKVYKRPGVAKHFPSSTADEECEELYKICKDNADVIISTTCLVHAGKYSAARGDYAKALEIFGLSFKQGIDQKLQANATTYAWALYNMGRAILAAGSTLNQRQVHVKDFNRRYHLTKSNETPEKWRKLLDELQSKIQ